MKTTLKRIFALMLVVVMCALVVGCKKKGPEYEYVSDYENVDGEYVEGDTAGNEGVAQNGKTTTKKKTTKSNKTGKIKNASNVNLKGYKFVLCSPWMAKSASEAQMDQEKQFFKIADQIMSETGCSIKVTSSNQNSLDDLRNQIMSGSRMADAVDVLSANVLAMAAAGYITPWNDVPGIDPSSSNFVQGYSKLGMVAQDYYGINWMRPPEARMCVVFNKDLLSGAGIDAEGIYTLVKNKQWKWDVLEDYAKRTTNGDVYGLGGYYVKVARALYTSNGTKLVSYTGAGKANGGQANGTYNSQAMVAAMNFFNKLVNEDKVYDASLSKNNGNLDTTDNLRYRDQFNQGRCAMMIEETFYVSKYFTNPSNFKFGIAPIPMGPNASSYITDATNARVWVCTSTNAKSKTVEKSVALMNEIASRTAANDIAGKKSYAGESWWQYGLKKEYFKGNTEDKNLEMYNICLDTSTTDPGTTVSALMGAFTEGVIGKGIIMGTSNISTEIGAIGASADKSIKSMFTFK